MKILVTGAAGFIGSTIAKKLILRGDEVIGIDNFNDYYPRKCKEFNVDLVNLFANRTPQFEDSENLRAVFGKLNDFEAEKQTKSLGAFHFHEGDITDYEFLEKIFKQGIDGVIHLAAMAGVPLSTKKPKLYANVNVMGTVNLMDLSTKYGTEKFLFGSSSSVYGNREDKKVTEEDDVSKAVSVYGATKVAGEVIGHSFSVIYGLKVMIIRIFGPIYGPLQRPYGMLHQRAINYTYNDKKLTVFGRHGLETAKDSTYIDDEVTGILKAFDSDFSFNVFNIGTANPLPISIWLDAIEKAFDKAPNYEVIEPNKADVISSADISKAKRELGYEPKVDMYEGVKRQVEVFKLMPEWYKSLEV